MTRHSSTSSSSSAYMPGRVGQPGREPGGAVGQRPRPAARAWRRARPASAPDRPRPRSQAQRAVPHQAHDVDGRGAVEARQVLAERSASPVDALGSPFQPRSGARSVARTSRAGGREAEPVLAHDLQRHALVQLHLVRGVGQRLQVGVRVHVGEPGQTTSPSTSIVRRAGSSSAPTATMRSPRMPTSARNHGLPVPSITRPPRMARSSIRGCRGGTRRAARRPYTEPGQQPAVDAQHDAGDERRLVRGQERHRRGDLLRRAHAADGIPARHRSSTSGSDSSRLPQAAVRMVPGDTAFMRMPWRP